MTSRPTSQISQVAEYLKSGKTLTQDMALALFKTTRLAAIIQNLKKQQNMHIITKMVSFGKRAVAEYHLDMANPVFSYQPLVYKAGTKVKPLSDMEKLILERLQKGEHISHLSAYLTANHCRRLATRIFYLKQHGYKIESKIVTAANGKKYAEYWMAV